MEFATVRVSTRDAVCSVRLDRPEHGNAINDTMIRDLHEALDQCERSCTVVVVEGGPDVFCQGADLAGYRRADDPGRADYDPSPLYELWTRLATGPFISVAHVRGGANAGGVGFVAACDIAIAGREATFALSEMLFGLYPAMLLPFLRRRIGHQRAHYMTLTTKSVSAEQAQDWGLVDVCADRSGTALAQHLGRLSKVPKEAVASYKRYVSGLEGALHRDREAAVAANREIFTDPRTLERITRFVEHGVYPWERVPVASESPLTTPGGSASRDGRTA